jgi:hypothetical protein
VGAKPGGMPVTIVTGLPRSGTSMMMQMLAAGGMPVLTDAARPPDADNPRGYLEFEPAKRTPRDAGWVAGAAGKAVKLVHVLLPALPPGHEYRLVFMHRDMNEVLASQRAMLEHLGRRGADLSPERLAAAFSEQLRRVREWMAQHPHVLALDVDYHKVIESAAAEARRVNQFLGGALDEAKMAAAVDPLLYRRRLNR